MRRTLVAMLWVVMAWLGVTTRAHAEQLVRSIIVLEPHAADAEPWAEGTRAVIAELMANGYELSIRKAHARRAVDLEAELRAALAEASAVGAVCLLARSEQKSALVLPRGADLVRIEAAPEEETVAESRLALRVVELFRNIDIPEPQSRRVPPTAPAPAPRPAPAPAHRFQSWLAGGVTLASDVAEPFGTLSLSGAVRLAAAFALDGTLGLSLKSARASSSAGELSLQTQLAAAYLMFDPLLEHDLGIALGLGGGLALLQESASPNPGYVGRADSTRAALLGARARAFVRAGELSIYLLAEPGLLLPAVSVQSDEQDFLRIGRPWLSLSAGVGWSP